MKIGIQLSLTSNTALTFWEFLLSIIFCSLKVDATVTLVGNYLRQIFCDIEYRQPPAATIIEFVAVEWKKMVIVASCAVIFLL